MRLNRFLASAGLGSRRGVEELITSGQVRINGQVVTDLSTQVGPTDAVKVGSRLLHQEQRLSVLLNKPKGFVCTASDERDRVDDERTCAGSPVVLKQLGKGKTLTD